MHTSQIEYDASTDRRANYILDYVISAASVLKRLRFVTLVSFLPPSPPFPRSNPFLSSCSTAPVPDGELCRMFRGLLLPRTGNHINGELPDRFLLSRRECRRNSLSCRDLRRSKHPQPGFRGAVHQLHGWKVSEEARDKTGAGVL